MIGDFIRLISNTVNARRPNPSNQVKKAAPAAGVKAPISKPSPKIEEKPVDAPEIKEEASKPTKAVSPFDKTKFYNHLRNTLIRSGIKTNQVLAMDALLDDMYNRPTSWIAYALATAWHETGGNMKPNTENLNYSSQALLRKFGRHRISAEDAMTFGRKQGERALSQARQRKIANTIYGGPWGKKNLGNTEPNDGWDFRGRGMDHCTGRRNYRVTGEAIGVDLISNPTALLVLENAIKALHTGMVTGRYAGDRTGRHNFARHLPSTGNATRAQFRSARRIINGVDAADQIASHALIFQEALNAAE